MQNADANSRVSLDFTLTEAEFTAFYTRSMNREYAPRRRKTNITGTVELVLALICNAYLYLGGIENRTAKVLGLLLLLLGLYSFGYFRVLFPWLLRRGAREEYAGSEALHGPATLCFASDGVTYTAAGVNSVYRWGTFARFVRVDGLYLFELEDGRTLLLPERALGEDRRRFEELLDTVCDRYDKVLDTVY